MSGVKIVVTGGSGFIGTHLVRELINRKYDVIVLDKRKPSVQCEYCQVDLLKPGKIPLEDVTHVFHLGALVGVARTEKEPVMTLDSSIIATKNILEACVKNDVGKIVFTSSSEVYGEPHVIPITEDSPTLPRSVYGLGKLASEEYIKAYNRKYGLNYSILRLSNVYGPGQSEEFVVPRFVGRILRKQPVYVYGTGEQIRTYCYVSEAVSGIIKGAFDDRAKGEIFNIGNDRDPISTLELSRTIAQLCRINAQIVKVPLEQTDRKDREVFRRIPDISKARTLLGYHPTVSLTAGLSRVVEFMKTKLSNDNLRYVENE